MKLLFKKVLLLLLVITIFGFFMYKEIAQVSAYYGETKYYLENAIVLGPYYNDVITINDEEVFLLSDDFSTMVNSRYFEFGKNEKKITAKNAYIELYKLQGGLFTQILKVEEGYSEISYLFQKDADYLMFVSVEGCKSINLIIEDKYTCDLKLGENIVNFKSGETKSFLIEVEKEDIYIISVNYDNISFVNELEVWNDKVYPTREIDKYQNYTYLYQGKNKLFFRNNNDYEVELKIIVAIPQEIELNENIYIDKPTLLKFTNKSKQANVFEIIGNNACFIQFENGMNECYNNFVTVPADSSVYILINYLLFQNPCEIIVESSQRQLFFLVDDELVEKNFITLEIGKEYKLDIVEIINNEIVYCDEKFKIKFLDLLGNGNLEYVTYIDGVLKINNKFRNTDVSVPLDCNFDIIVTENTFLDGWKYTNTMLGIIPKPSSEEIFIEYVNDEKVVIEINSTKGRCFDLEIQIINDSYLINKIIKVRPNLVIDKDLDYDNVSFDLTKYLMNTKGYTEVKVKRIKTDSPQNIIINLESNDYLKFEKLKIHNLFYGGNGTAEDPYQIKCQRHFKNIRLCAQNVRYEEDQTSLMILDNFAILNDIELTDVFEPFPILKGSLKSANGEVKDIRIVWLCTGSGYNGSGLFETIWGGEVSDISVEIVYELNKDGTYGIRKGAICGYLIDGKINNCTSKGYFNNIEYNSKNSFIGGIVGEALRGEIINCNSSIIITTNGKQDKIIAEKTDNVIIK